MGRKNSKHRKINIKDGAYAATAVLIGAILCMLSGMSQRNNISDNLVLRNDEKEKEISLVATSDYGEKTYDLSILPKRMSEEETAKAYEEYKNKLKSTILADNESFDKIKTHLNLVETVDEYPFESSYKILPRGVIDENGDISDDALENTDISIEITTSYGQEEFIETVEAKVIPEEMSEETIFGKKLQRILNDENEENQTEDVKLPDEVDGIKIEWKEKKQSKVPGIIVLTVTIAGYFLFKQKIQDNKKIKERKESMIKDYPGFAVKYSLLIGAGLNHRQVMEKMVCDYGNREDSPLYEELITTLSEIKSGVSQTEALSQMADRIGLREMNQFISLVNQNIRKGGQDIAKEMKTEAENSMNLKREEVKRKAETASTKLLIPMIIHLVIVFALIMIPAFGSLKF